MLEFVKGNYCIVAYGIALILALAKYRFYYESTLRYFPVIIGYTLLSEILGYLVSKYEDIQIVYLDKFSYSYYNHLIFNIFDIVFFLYFFYIYWKVIDVPKYKRFIEYGTILFIGSSLINPFFQNILILPQLMAITMGSVALIVCIVLYFKTLSKKPDSNLEFDNLLSWVGIGLLAFYPFYPIIMFLGFHYELYVKYHVRLLQHIAIALMYGFFIIGFIRTQRSVLV